MGFFMLRGFILVNLQNSVLSRLLSLFWKACQKTFVLGGFSLFFHACRLNFFHASEQHYNFSSSKLRFECILRVGFLFLGGGGGVRSFLAISPLRRRSDGKRWQREPQRQLPVPGTFGYCSGLRKAGNCLVPMVVETTGTWDRGALIVLHKQCSRVHAIPRRGRTSKSSIREQSLLWFWLAL